MNQRMIKVKQESKKAVLKFIQKTKIMVSGPVTSWQIDGETMEAVTNFIFLSSKISVDGDCSHMKLKDSCSLEEKLWQTCIVYIKKQGHHFANKDPYSQNYGFSSSHVWMWELDHKENWWLKNWCFQIVVIGNTLECPLNSKEIKPVNPKGNKPSVFIGRTGTEAEVPILWPPDVKGWLIGKDPDAGKDWRSKDKGAAEDNMVR